MTDENETVSMSNSKTEILEYLAENEIEADEDLTKLELLGLIDDVEDEDDAEDDAEDDVEDDAEDEEVEVEAEAAPAAAIVPEQIVTRRGTPVGGTRTMPKSEYDKEMSGGKNKN